MKILTAVLVLIMCHCVSAQVVSRYSYGFQCGQGNDLSCPIVNGRVQWPNTRAQPGVLRLWDALVNWNDLQRTYGYDWKMLDMWLSQINDHQPLSVVYTLGHTPCYLVPTAPCGTFGAADPPPDLTSKGSAQFNAFVQALVTHCSPTNICVKDVIKNWELWNEPNLTPYWTGTAQQCYEMMKPAVKIIRDNVPGALIYTPPVASGDTAWMTSWLDLEKKKGRLSDVFAFHIYLNANKVPEQRISLVQSMLDLKDSYLLGAPWSMTETNYDAATWDCSYSHDDCVGQIIRWQMLNMALGGSVYWFRFNYSIGHEEHRTSAYANMMSWLDGAKLGTCTVNPNGLNSCPLTLQNGNQAIIVWNVGDDTPYQPLVLYNQYRDFVTGKPVPTSGFPVSVGKIPILFEHVDR